jgi:SNF family Na+-dependent transporter
MVPRIGLMWAAPILGTLVASLVARVSLLRSALGAQALAVYTVCSIYCLVHREGKIIDTLQYVTMIYFLPGAMLALLIGLLMKWIFQIGRS